MNEAEQVVRRYYEEFTAKRPGWRDLVTEDVTLKGPVQQAAGKTEFVALTEQFLQPLRETRLLERVASGNSVLSVYAFTLDAPDGGTMSCEVAEVARVRAGRVAEWELFYDPREFVHRFGLQ